MPDRAVLCDASPLIYLHRIGQLDVLRRLYGEIIVPAAVAEELRVGRQLSFDCPQLAALPWVHIEPLPGNASPMVVPDLGPGEAELIALARLHPGCVVVIDETLGRHIAKLNGLAVTGTVGVLLRAKQRGHIASLTGSLNRLLAEGFWLDDDTFRWLQKAAGE
jgi:predicted nucleic acid-binding protein